MKDQGPPNGRGGSPSPLPTGMRTKRSPAAAPGAGREGMIAFVVKDSADDEERRRAEAIVAAGAPKWSRKSSKSPARHAQRPDDAGEAGWDAVVDALASNPPTGGIGAEATEKQDVGGAQHGETGANGPSWDEVTVALREAREDAARIASERLEAEKAHSSALQKRLSALEARSKAERAHLRWRLTTSQAMHVATAARLSHATSLSITSAAFREWRHKTGRSPTFLIRRARRDNLRRVWFRSWRATRPWRKVACLHMAAWRRTSWASWVANSLSKARHTSQVIGILATWKLKASSMRSRRKMCESIVGINSELMGGVCGRRRVSSAFCTWQRACLKSSLCWGDDSRGCGGRSVYLVEVVERYRDGLVRRAMGVWGRAGARGAGRKEAAEATLRQVEAGVKAQQRKRHTARLHFHAWHKWASPQIPHEPQRASIKCVGTLSETPDATLRYLTPPRKLGPGGAMYHAADVPAAALGRSGYGFGIPPETLDSWRAAAAFWGDSSAENSPQKRGISAGGSVLSAGGSSAPGRVLSAGGSVLSAGGSSPGKPHRDSGSLSGRHASPEDDSGSPIGRPLSEVGERVAPFWGDLNLSGPRIDSPEPQKWI